jgi:predicted dehydrogenase
MGKVRTEDAALLLAEFENGALDDPEEARGFCTILVTERVHPYVSAWWPPGHIIGYEHTCIHGMADFIQAVVGRGKMEPNFFDGYKNKQVLDAALTSAELGKRIPLT